MYIYVSICKYIYMYIYTCICICIYIYICICIYTYICICICIYKYICICICIYIYICICIYICMYIYIYKYVCLCISIYILHIHVIYIYMDISMPPPTVQRSTCARPHPTTPWIGRRWCWRECLLSRSSWVTTMDVTRLRRSHTGKFQHVWQWLWDSPGKWIAENRDVDIASGNMETVGNC